MPRRGNSLSISTILKKAQRQGVSIYTLMILTERLREISGQKAKTVTDDNKITVKKLLEEGIRLHPFLLQPNPITPDQMPPTSDSSARSRRNMRALTPPEDLSLPPEIGLTEGAGTGNIPTRRRQRVVEEDLSLPGANLEDLTLPKEPPPGNG